MRFRAGWKIAIVASDEAAARWVNGYFLGRGHWGTRTVDRVTITSVQWLSNVDGQDVMVSPVDTAITTTPARELDGGSVTVSIVFAVTRVGGDGLPPAGFTTWLRSSVADHRLTALCVLIDAAPSPSQVNGLLYWLWAEKRDTGLPSVRLLRETGEQLKPPVWPEFLPFAAYHPDYRGDI
jgi:hypothetical protein